MNSNRNLHDLGQWSIKELDMGRIIGLQRLMWSEHTPLCHRAHTGSETHPPEV